MRILTMLLLGTTLTFIACKDEEKTPTCADGLQNQSETDVDCGGPCTSCKEAAHGKWKSYPVAPILTTFADSITAEFKLDGTYQMNYWKDGIATLYSGNFVQIKTGIATLADIYSVQLQQKTPVTASLSGILMAYENGFRMTYETVQTLPAIGATPPLATTGFGSSQFNGVALGNNVIQEYRRVQ